MASTGGDLGSLGPGSLGPGVGCPGVVPAALRTPPGGLWAVCDRLVWANGTFVARVPGFRWWRVLSAVLIWVELRGHHEEVASSPHAHLRATATGDGGSPRPTRTDQLTGFAIFLGVLCGVVVVLAAAAVAGVYAGVPAPVASAALDVLAVVVLLSLGEYFFIAAQGWRRGRFVSLAWAELHREGHRGVVVILSGYSARPWKRDHGDRVMRAWLAHVDTHRIAVIADARNTTLTQIYVDRYGFQLIDSTHGRLLMRVPVPAPSQLEPPTPPPC